MRVPGHFSLLFGLIAMLTLWNAYLWLRWPFSPYGGTHNEAPKRKNVAPLTLKNAYLWLSWPSLMRGYQDIFSIVGTIEWQATERSEGVSPQRMSEAREHPPSD